MTGCGVPVEGSCKRPVGNFHGAYTIADGNCGPFAGRDLLIGAEDPGSTTRDLKTLSDKVTTEVTLIGCSINLAQKITDPEGITTYSELSGVLNVLDDESALEGVMSYTEYMPDGLTQRCRSTVNALYTLSGGTIGAAAQIAQQHP